MEDRAKEIRKRHEQRKKHQHRSGDSKGKPVTYQEVSDREDHLTVIPSYVKDKRPPNGHHLARKQWTVFRLMLAIVLFLAVGVMFKSHAPVLDGARGFVDDTFDHEFQFAKIGDWYEQQFGEPLALFPKSKDTHDQKVDQKPQGSDYAEPVSGTVKESFDDTQKGILLQTGNKAGVKAVQEGIVVSVGKEGDLGKVVKVEHSDGTESWYGKLADVDIKLYDFVKQGEKIGKVTPSDDKGKGTFYFALKKGDTFINPIKVISFD